ncbi:MAG TPA: chromosome partitioning protein ParB, partial [Caulobacteraceae bacterium]|nr:chromosome partitioning protein ParB [Caulobacteraceae bacterium]
MTTSSKIKAIDESARFEDRDVRLGDLGLAPENPRAKEGADDGIPQLAETLAVTVLHRLIVRPGRKGEKPMMALDGRRRLLGFEALLAAGRIDADFQVPCRVALNKAAEIAGVFLPEEKLPVHIADIITAIGRLRKAKVDSAGIAKALGYDELEIRRLMLLSELHPKAIEALRR